ncbi:MAG: acyl-ACP--UDP-N-acetylglucosamine O-acyltransferase [Fibrobacteres bacterium]|nr:acyl-ACP--UDP-N-acetylglucosamine O-acyltransferase [Fibrobacterota bacterium]
MATIHPSSIIDNSAEIDTSVEIGPFCYIGPKVKIGANTRIISHLRIEGPTTIGSGNIFYPFSNIGAAPQDLKYKGEDSELIIGNDNTIRECVTLNRGTLGGGNVTKIGNGCLLMANSHVGHDAIIGNGVILANSVAIAGHVIVQDNAIVGGLTGVTQFCIIGKHAYIGANSMIHKDVPPFTTAIGNPVVPRGINKVGLTRKGYTEEAIKELVKVFKIFFLQGLTVAEAEKEVVAKCDLSQPETAFLVDFIRTSPNGIAR